MAAHSSLVVQQLSITLPGRAGRGVSCSWASATQQACCSQWDWGRGSRLWLSFLLPCTSALGSSPLIIRVFHKNFGNQAQSNLSIFFSTIMYVLKGFCFVLYFIFCACITGQMHLNAKTQLLEEFSKYFKEYSVLLNFRPMKT